MASPLGQPRDVLSSTRRSDPSRLALSICGRSPQSVQYMKLEEHGEGVVKNVYVYAGEGIHPRKKQNKSIHKESHPRSNAHLPTDRVQDYRSRFIQIFRNQNLAGGPVEPRDLWTAQVETTISFTVMTCKKNDPALTPEPW